MECASFSMKSEMPWGVSFAVGIPKGVWGPFCAGATGKFEGAIFPPWWRGAFQAFKCLIFDEKQAGFP